MRASGKESKWNVFWVLSQEKDQRVSRYHRSALVFQSIVSCYESETYIEIALFLLNEQIKGSFLFFQADSHIRFRSSISIFQPQVVVTLIDKYLSILKTVVYR